MSGRNVEISNPGKVYFPGLGATKLDVVGYYLAVADPILRATAGRPAMLQRFPDGALWNSFFQNVCPKALRSGSGRSRSPRRTARRRGHLSSPDMAHIVWAVNLGCLGFHVWPFHVDDPGHSDELRIDLDPQTGVGFDQVRESSLVREGPPPTSSASWRTRRPAVIVGCTSTPVWSLAGTPSRSGQQPWRSRRARASAP